MRRSDLELILRRAGAVAREKHFILFGSQAIWGLLENVPRELTFSLEIDLYPRTRTQAVLLIEEKLGRASRFNRRYGCYADCVTPEVACLPDGWLKRLVPFRTTKTRGVTGWCVELHDLAVSKLVVGREKDYAFVQILLKKRCVEAEILKERSKVLPINMARKKALMRKINAISKTRRP
jgi:hypothetical protein